MAGVLAPPAAATPDVLRREGAHQPLRSDGERLRPWVGGLIRQRHAFGITRIGSLTRLDRIGIPVVQVTRPLALSNAVCQGKGLDVLTAAASALMEALETWAAERIPASAIGTSPLSFYDAELAGLYAPWLSAPAVTDWIPDRLSWIEGWDLLAGRSRPVPLALVDTAYAYPSSHPRVFPRATTGLGAGSSMTQAIVQAGLEILERDALVRARRTPYFYERSQVELSTVTSGRAADVLNRIRKADLLVGAWRAAAPHRLPVFRCHVMESEHSELAPLPAEGSACRFDEEHALTSALLEACQARLTAIAGAREDVTRRMYPPTYDREHLAQWRTQLRSPGVVSCQFDNETKRDLEMDLEILLKSFARSGASAAIVVPLFADDEKRLHVVRMVAPPLHLGA
jgi:ribosomal protein S12 methylthiotransferase accessory factor